MGGEELLAIITGYTEATRPRTAADRPPRRATVAHGYDPRSYPSTLPPVIFDGEPAPTRAGFAALSGYVPAPGDRVLMLPIGDSEYVILGRIDGPAATASTMVYSEPGTLTWARPDNTRLVWVRAVGGGGAGGGAASTSSGESSGGSGGQAGGYAEAWIPSYLLPTTVEVIVGSGGTATPGGPGGDGGDTRFGTLVAAGGGAGGLTLTASGTPGANNGGGYSTVALLGDVTADGQGGGAGMRLGSTGAVGGMGGSSVWGSGGRGLGAVTGQVSGTDGRGPGGGGSGGAAGPTSSAQRGGEGGPGALVVVAYQ
ncbi:hypothetical protein BJF83_20925 [Nocardiopsis sp. CNR-923]|uniref:glycine-rich domain-containing protein n=1 Tax=Nocardiopsis sp. CNR-923 TaxID=1904965 RepID=UPI00096A18FC|nr:hypothetical protein [Nocardiopsis sp. CNR-923]OLT26551.1 hypothetical protein BJF83_20925 [Nocardiopsis sp. CNR-923]